VGEGTRGRRKGQEGKRRKGGREERGEGKGRKYLGKGPPPTLNPGYAHATSHKKDNSSNSSKVAALQRKLS
jgi:hypothetical protein